MTSLSGQTVIVTGGAMGLGRAIAEEFVAAGAGVALFDVNLDAAEQTAEHLRDGGAKARAYRVDVARSDKVDAAVDEVVADFGRLDVLINNAGVSMVGPHIADLSDEIWNTSIGVMQTGVFNCMRAATRHLLPQRSGSVVNISSIRGFSPRPGRLAYCASKAAVIMMTQVAAAEWGPYGVRANAIAPGVQRTPMWDVDVARGVVNEERVLAATPLGRLGDPREIGQLAVFLASDAAAFITGSCITIDGGMTLIPSDGSVEPATI